MKLVHELCINFKTRAKPFIEYFNKEKDTQFQMCFDTNGIIFLMEGSALFSFGNKVDQRIEKGEMFFLSSKEYCSVTTESDISFLVFHLTSDVRFCEHYSLEMLYEEGRCRNYNEDSDVLKINDMLQSFLETIRGFITNEIGCNYFWGVKIKEFFYLFRASYPKENLFAFFSPILNNDIVFSTAVYKYYRKAGTAKELAALMNYSLSGFEKRFKKVFNVSAHQWMQAQMMKSVYFEIVCTRKTFTEIAFEYGFSSPSHFSHFSKMKLGGTPGKIREKHGMVIKK